MNRTVILHYHLFKNAGTSVDHLLKLNFPGGWVTREFATSQHSANLAEVCAWVREESSAVVFSSHTALLPPPSLDGIEIFPIVFVRHPIDRIASAYTFERNQGGDSFGAVLARNTTLAGYVEVRLSLQHDRQCREFHVARFGQMINEPGMAEGDRALRAVKALPFVGLVEDFDASVGRLAELLRPRFPGFQVAAVAKNATRDPSSTLEQRLDAIRGEIGDACYEKLLEVNQFDLDIWGFVNAGYAITTVQKCLCASHSARFTHGNYFMWTEAYTRKAGFQQDEIKMNDSVKFPVPLQFRRGSLRHDERASVDSALRILEVVENFCTIRDAKILDYGCGVKLVQGLFEIGNPQKKYCGVDVHPGLINFLKENVRNGRYEFAALNFHNAMYNRKGEKMSAASRLPIRDDRYSLLTMFSVVTHMVPEDTLATFQILRGYAEGEARLIFSTFIDPDQREEFIDKVPDEPMLNAYYRKDFLDELLRLGGWRIESFSAPIKSVIQHHYVCRPA